MLFRATVQKKFKEESSKHKEEVRVVVSLCVCFFVPMVVMVILIIW